jgi:hypothetical protein
VISTATVAAETIVARQSMLASAGMLRESIPLREKIEVVILPLLLFEDTLVVFPCAVW